MVGMFLPKELRDILHAMRGIRNSAAHDVNVFQLSQMGQEFSNNVVSATKRLQVYKTLETKLPASINTNIPKVHFTMCAAVLAAYIKATDKKVGGFLKNTTLNFS